MANPIDSFMRGFAVVDQLETNRQMRDFREQEMSRTRELWARQDQEYEKAKLQEYQQTKLVEFDYELQNLTNEIAAEAQALEQNGDQEAADNLRNKWFTSNTFTDGEFRGVSLAVQEVVKRMQQKDPSFGEHIALAAGRDPGAGRLVNSKEPVANVMVVPPQASPNGQASIAFELNRSDGKLGPMTNNRTDADNDPVDFVPIDTQLAFKVFGPGFADNSLASARLLRGMFEGPEQRGNPRAVEKADATAPAGGGGKEENRPSTIQRPEDQNMGLLEEQIVDTTDLTDQERKDLFAETNPEVYGEPEPTSELDRQLPNTIEEVSNINAAYERAKSDPTAHNVGQAAMYITTAGARLVQSIGEDAWKALGRAGGGPGFVQKGSSFIRGFLGVDEPGQNVPIAGREAKNAGDVTAAGNKPSDYTADKVANDPDSAIENAPAADSNATTQGMAQSVQQTRRRPTIPQLMNASSLAKMGVIDPESLQRYARTGSWDEPSKAQLHNLGNGTFAIFDPETREVQLGNIGAAGGGPSLGDLRKQVGLEEDIFDFVYKQIETSPDFTDDEGNVYTRGVNQVMQVAEEVYGLFGVRQDNIGRTNDLTLNNLARGARFIQRFDEGDLSFFNWPFNDLEPQFTAMNVAIGAQLAQTGIVDQKSATFALRSYLKTAYPALRGKLSDTQFIAYVRETEKDVQDAIDNGDTRSREKIREELIEDDVE